MVYNLTNLGSLDFENMVAALFERTFGPKVGQFGIGPDGGREATYEGKLTSVGEDPVDWDGYVVLQAKFRARPLGTAPDQNWLIKAITDELREWDSATSERRKAGDIPDYLVIASNVVLTPVAGSGGIDRLEKALSVLASRVGVKGWLVWHHDKICRMLDDAPGIRRTYAALLTSGDVLSQLLDNLEGDAAHLENVLRAFTGQTLIHQRHVRLTESGGTGNLTLEQVGVDLPCSNVKGSEARTAIQALIDVGDTDLRANFERRGDALATHLLVGGPGQGKSTLSNLLAQVYRVALLMDKPGRNGPQAEQIINDSLETWKQAGLRLPRKRRWPLRIDLAQVTIDGSLFKNITALVRHRTGTKVTAPELISWFQQWPWLIILDGFDEVASADARTKVQDSVLGFLSDAAT